MSIFLDSFDICFNKTDQEVNDIAKKYNIDHKDKNKTELCNEILLLQSNLEYNWDLGINDYITEYKVPNDLISNILEATKKLLGILKIAMEHVYSFDGSRCEEPELIRNLSFYTLNLIVKVEDIEDNDDFFDVLYFTCFHIILNALGLDESCKLNFSLTDWWKIATNRIDSPIQTYEMDILKEMQVKVLIKSNYDFFPIVIKNDPPSIM